MSDQKELNQPYYDTVLANLIHNNEITVDDKSKYILSDEEYDKMVNEINPSHLHEDVEHEDFTIFSLLKHTSVTLDYPLLVSMKIDGSCICLRFKRTPDKKIWLIKVYTKNYNNLKNNQLLDKLLVKFEDFAPVKNIVKKIENIAFDEIMVRVELYGVTCGKTNPASYAAASISCDVDKFSNYNVDMKVVEIPYIIRNKVNVPVMQKKVFEIFEELSVPHKIVTNESEFKLALSEYTRKPDTDDELSDISSIPCDGIVYSKDFWSYPFGSSIANKSVNYGKYAVKTYSSHVTKIIGEPEYCISVDGLISCSLSFEPLTVGNKNYSKSKFPTSRFGEIGIGSEISLEFASQAFPQIKDVLSKADKPFVVPKNCMFCNMKLDFSADGIVYCNNKNCKEVHLMLMHKFVSACGLKGVGLITLKNNVKTIPITFNSMIKSLQSRKKALDKEFIDKVLNLSLLKILIYIGYIHGSNACTKLSSNEMVDSKGKSNNMAELTIRELVQQENVTAESILGLVTLTKNMRSKQTPAKREFTINLINDFITISSSQCQSSE